MSGWLPFEGEIARSLKIDEGDQGESESGAEEDDDGSRSPTNTDSDDVPAHIQAVNHIRDILGMPPFQSDADDSENALRTSYLGTPIFLGHGSADSKMSVDLGIHPIRWIWDGCDMEGI